MCDRPLKGFKIGVTKNNRSKFMVCSPDVNFVWCDANDNWHKSFDNMDSFKFRSKDIVKDYTLIPCGKCVACQITRAAEMANRCMLEMKYHDKASFITLTYDDEHLHVTNYTYVPTGETGVSNTLFKADYQRFLKRLRKKYPDCDFKYLLCGEYGSVSQRAHYHIILFGYWPEDARPWSINKRGQTLYVSEELNELWKLGYVIVGEVTRDSCNYVARYVTKKLYSNLGKEEYENKGRIPPFIASSKRPAIGRKWYEDNKDWCFDHQISYSTPEGGISFNAPRYFHKLKWSDVTKDTLLSEKFMLYCEQMDNRLEANKIAFKYEKNMNDAKWSEIGDAKDRERRSKAKAYTRDSI